jgi:hypothetical protein
MKIGAKTEVKALYTADKAASPLANDDWCVVGGRTLYAPLCLFFTTNSLMLLLVVRMIGTQVLLCSSWIVMRSLLCA